MLLVRFALVGLGVAALYVVGFLLLLQLGMAKVPANVLAFALAVGVQYIAQAAFTFRKRLNDRSQMARFVCMVGAGLLSATAITSGFGPMLGLSDLSAAVLVTLVLPIQNFFLMKLWVFTHRPTTDEVTS